MNTVKLGSLALGVVVLTMAGSSQASNLYYFDGVSPVAGPLDQPVTSMASLGDGSILMYEQSVQNRVVHYTPSSNVFDIIGLG